MSIKKTFDETWLTFLSKAQPFSSSLAQAMYTIDFFRVRESEFFLNVFSNAVQFQIRTIQLYK